MPIGPLMIEHRLIEKVIPVLKRVPERLAAGDPRMQEMLDLVVDFFRTYADALHHGKEEGILFRDLRAKPLTPEQLRVLEELVAEHVVARRVVRRLANGRDGLRAGEAGAAAEVVAAAGEIVALYPGHIAKEDRQFFIPIMKHFTREEQDRMLQEFWEFDQKAIHTKYQKAMTLLREWPAS
jgi:hemerythrin-like domain-containing protein